MDNKNQSNTEINSLNSLNSLNNNPNTKRNKSIKNLHSFLNLNKLNNNYELPFINSKNKIKNSDKSINKFKKLSFNFISYDYKNRLKLLSQLTPLTQKIKKHYSSKEIKEFNKKIISPINYQRTMNSDISSKKTRNKNYSNIISRNLSYINDKSSSGIIDLSNGFLTKDDTKNNNTKNENKENKEKISLPNCQRFIDLRKDLEKILNPKRFRDKKYEIKKHFVHNCLFKSNTLNSDIIKNEDKNMKEIFPKFEYINYFGITHKLITRLTSNNKNNSEEKNNNKNKYIKLQIKLKSPDLLEYQNFDDCRNKKYIQKIEKKIKNKKKLEKEIIDENKEFIKNMSEQTKKSYKKIVENNKRFFDKYIYGVLVEKNMIDNKLNNLIEIDKKVYGDDFDNLKSNK